MKMAINPDDLTIGEIIEIEERAGIPFAQIGKALSGGDQPIGKLVAALSFIQMRRDNPDATWEQALAVKPLVELTVGDDVDPQSPPSEPTS